MSLSPQMQSAIAPLDLAFQRKAAKAFREARFDIRQGSGMTARDAEDNARLAGTELDRHYWKSYAAEMRRQGHR